MLSPIQFWKSLSNQTRWFLLGCGIVSLLIHILAAIFSIGFYLYDEHYQILEFAWMKSGHSTLDNMAWEYTSMCRPSLQPWIAIAVFKLMGMTDPFKMVFVLRLFSSLLGFASLVPFCLLGMQWLKNDLSRKIFPFLLAVLPIISFVHARFSSEGFGGTFTMFGIVFLLISQTKDIAGIPGKAYFYLFLSGISFAIAFVCRIQMGLAFPGILFWAIFIEKIKFRKLLVIGLTVLMVLVICAILDRLYYGVWVNTLWLYFKINLLEGKANSFGTSPFSFFFSETIIKAGYIWGVLFVATIIIGWLSRPMNIFTLAFAPYFILHCFIGHKELRFLFPMVSALPLFIAFAVEYLKIHHLNPKQIVLKIASLILAVIFPFSILLWTWDTCLSPARVEFYAYKYLDRYRSERMSLISMYYPEGPYGPEGHLNMDVYKPHSLVKKYHMPDAPQIKQIVDSSKYPVFLYIPSSDAKTPEVLLESGVHYSLEYASLPSWFMPIMHWRWIYYQPSIMVYRLAK